LIAFHACMSHTLRAVTLYMNEGVDREPFFFTNPLVCMAKEEFTSKHQTLGKGHSIAISRYGKLSLRYGWFWGWGLRILRTIGRPSGHTIKWDIIVSGFGQKWVEKVLK